VATTIRDAALLFHVQVEQLSGSLPLVADHLTGRTVQVSQPRHPMALQHRMHRGGRLAQRPRDLVGADPVGGAIGQDGLLTVGLQSPGLVWGREQRSARPASPSSWLGRSHLSAVATDTPWASAARGTGQPWSQIRSTSSRRPWTVSFALGWAMRASTLGTWTVLSSEALIPSTTCLGTTPDMEGLAVKWQVSAPPAGR
jgi:hypothetical protein